MNEASGPLVGVLQARGRVDADQQQRAQRRLVEQRRLPLGHLQRGDAHAPHVNLEEESTQQAHVMVRVFTNTPTLTFIFTTLVYSLCSFFVEPNERRSQVCRTSEYMHVSASVGAKLGVHAFEKRERF